jgi:hypothetical protein
MGLGYKRVKVDPFFFFWQVNPLNLRVTRQLVKERKRKKK